MAKRGRKVAGGRVVGRRLRARSWLALVALGLVAFLYYRPLVAYFDARSALERRSAEVAALRAERRALEQRLESRLSDEALVREARTLGYVRPGERLFIVTGVADWRRERARERAQGAGTLAPDG